MLNLCDFLMSPLYPDVEAFSSMIQKLWTTNVFLKCLAMHALLAYLCIYVCALLSLCVFVYRTAAHFKPLRRLLRVENSDTDVRSNMERRLKTHPDIISL